jgi:hypothetical protein
MSGHSAFGWVGKRPFGARPFVTVIMLASAPPTKNPLSKAWRMLRTSYSSRQSAVCRSAWSYESRAPLRLGTSPRRSAWKAASAASRPDSIA